MAALSGERLKVLMTADSVGGVWRYAMDLCMAVREHGVEPIIAGLGPRPHAIQEREAFRSGIKLVWLDAELDWVATGPPALEHAARLLDRVIDDFRPDVLHLNSPALAHLVFGSVPCVATVHSCLASWWAAVRGTALPFEWEWNRDHVERGLRAASLVVVPTRAFAAAISAIYGPLPRLGVIPNGSRAANAVFLDTIKEARVMAAGRWWDEAKNLATLRAAAPAIAWPVEIAGPLVGPNGTRVDAGPLRSLGTLGPQACTARMEETALFVSPALYEPFGLSVLEAAGRGSALALADIPTFRELWDGAALFFPPRDCDLLARSVNRLIDDRALRAELAARAFERASIYSLDVQAQAMVQAWRHASGKRSLAA
jgi:glycosyltransferase involved in cell wall biosynthesis